MDLIRVGRFEEFASKTKENILEEVVYVAVKCIITMVKFDLEILIGRVVMSVVGLRGLWRKKGRLLPRYSTPGATVPRVLFTRRRLRGRESGG